MDDPTELKEHAWAQYCLSSGRFFHAYTALESELTMAVFVAVTRFTRRDTRKKVLLAVLGGQRMQPLKDTIKRLMRATNANTRRMKFVDDMFSQLGEIQFFRDRLTHHFTQMDDERFGHWTNMNFASIRELEKFEDITFHVSTLDAAADDLQQMRILVGKLFSHYVRNESAAVPQLPAWQYKPAMLVRYRPHKSDSRPKRKRPPRSSRA